MNHTAILKAFVTRLSSEDLAECSRMAAQAEYDVLQKYMANL